VACGIAGAARGELSSTLLTPLLARLADVGAARGRALAAAALVRRAGVADVDPIVDALLAALRDERSLAHVRSAARSLALLLLSTRLDDAARQSIVASLAQMLVEALSHDVDNERDEDDKSQRFEGFVLHYVFQC
jgi:ABC-type thiamine transport system ATPase subunit